MGSASYFLSNADDVNSATLKRLHSDPLGFADAEDGFKERPSKILESSPTLVVFDWDDTLFPTTWTELDRGDDDARTGAYAATAQAAVALLRTARTLGEVVIVSLAEVGWVDKCLALAGDAELSAEVASIQIIYARTVAEVEDVWPRTNWPPQSACPLGAMQSSRWGKAESTAQRISAKMEAMRRCIWDGCSQVISIGDSEYERFAIHDLQFADRNLANILYKTIKFPMELGAEDLGAILVMAEKIFQQFGKQSVAMDVALRLGDSVFLNNLKFAMQRAHRSNDNSEDVDTLKPRPYTRSIDVLQPPI
jgi:hypothetical protein